MNDQDIINIANKKVVKFQEENRKKLYDYIHSDNIKFVQRLSAKEIWARNYHPSWYMRKAHRYESHAHYPYAAMPINLFIRLWFKARKLLTMRY